MTARRAAALGRLDDPQLGLEAGLAADDHLALRLWLRLLACSNQIGTEIRRRLRARHGITLSRFDYLAQLHRHPEGLRMNTLSRHLMVTGGNVTGLTDELEKEGLVQRQAMPGDRRAILLRLTAAGRAAFERIAAEHESWVIELMGGLGSADQRRLYQLLGRLRLAIAQPRGDADADATPAWHQEETTR